MLMALPGLAQPDPTDSNEARWAELEAQARVADGDYDGAVQAEQQAAAVRHDTARRVALPQPPKP